MSFRSYPSYTNSVSPWIKTRPSHWVDLPGRRLFRQVRESALESDVQLSATQKYGVVPQAMFMELEDQQVVLALTGTSNFQHVAEDDFVISLRSFQGGIERSRYVGCVSPAYTVLRRRHELDPDFVEFLLKSAGYIAALQTVTEGIREGKTIRYEQFGDVRLPVPPINEQAEIAAFLRKETAKIDALVAEQEKLIGLLKEKRQAVISHAVTKGLDPTVPMRDSGVAWLGEVPAHWGIVPVKYLADVGNGSTPNRDRLDYWDGGNYPWLSSTVVNQDLVQEAEEFVTQLALNECHLPIIQPPAVLIGITGQGKTRGMAAILCIEATINQHVAYVKPSSKRLSVQFLHRYFEMAYEQMRFESEGAGSTKGAITCGQISNMRMPCPPIDEQGAITAYLDREIKKLDALVVEAQAAIEVLQERRDALISATVTGQIDVRAEVEAPA